MIIIIIIIIIKKMVSDGHIRTLVKALDPNHDPVR